MKYTKPSILAVVKADHIIQSGTGGSLQGQGKMNLINPDVTNPAVSDRSTTGAYDADE